MTKDKLIEENFSDILSMLKKKVQEKDEEIMRLREENIKLKTDRNRSGFCFRRNV